MSDDQVVVEEEKGVVVIMVEMEESWRRWVCSREGERLS
jgi:hypothetical protein